MGRSVDHGDCGIEAPLQAESHCLKFEGDTELDHRMRLLFLAICLLTFKMMVPVSGAERPPNFVLILADDLGYGDVGCFGAEDVSTPRIDSLCRSGLKFTDFHSAGPMCSPTRASLLTGLYPQRFGSKFDGALSGVSDRDTGLPHASKTLAERLKAADYSTACFGKWHLGYVPPWLPTSHGFDEFRGLGSGDGDFHTRIDRSGNEDWYTNDKLTPEPGYTTELISRDAVDFIQRNRDQPFFLYVAHLAIHFPWQGPGDPPHREKGGAYHDDKWGVIPNPKKRVRMCGR